MSIKKLKERVQVNGKAGSGKTINMSGLPQIDEILREKGFKIKLEPFKANKEKKAVKRRIMKKVAPKKKK